mmetsp:Transcript_20858/g.30881  ORF Transcript_20858/g.30881 Transcript_20858/m.30881 type:complete len:248 (-) Transcript_20858:129-872(-)
MKVITASATLVLFLTSARQVVAFVSQTIKGLNLGHSRIADRNINAHPSEGRRKRMFALPFDSPDEFYILTVCHEGMTGEILVHRNETILAALERQSDILCLTQLPFECRRGNCLTCAGRVVECDDVTKAGSKENILQVEDGLPPHTSEQLRSSDQLLLCSSYLTGSGVSIVLGNDYPKNHVIWNSGGQQERQRTKLAATAKLFRLQAEQNLQQWKEDTEHIFHQSQELQFDIEANCDKDENQDDQQL